MTWSDIPLNPAEKTLRQFAAAWLVFFLGSGAHQYLVRGHHRLGLALGAAALSFGILGLIKPVKIQWLFTSCMRLAFPIGWLVSQLMLLLMFYCLITPVAVFFRFRGRDVLGRKPNPDQASFWLPTTPPTDVRGYFRQY